MIITKEQQEAWVSNYIKEKHTQDECIGFIDGVEKALDVVNKNFDLALVSGRSPASRIKKARDIAGRIFMLYDEKEKTGDCELNKATDAIYAYIRELEQS